MGPMALESIALEFMALESTVLKLWASEFSWKKLCLFPVSVWENPFKTTRIPALAKTKTVKYSMPPIPNCGHKAEYS